MKLPSWQTAATCPEHGDGQEATLRVLFGTPGRVTEVPRQPVGTLSMGRQSVAQASVTAPKVPPLQVALTVPLQEAAQGVELVFPLVVEGNVTGPQTDPTTVAGHVQPSVIGPKVPLVHVALTVPPVQDPGQAAELELPLTTEGNVAAPQEVPTAVAGHPQPLVTGPKVPLVHVALNVPLHPPGHAIELTEPLVVAGNDVAPQDPAPTGKAGQSSKHVLLGVP